MSSKDIKWNSAYHHTHVFSLSKHVDSEDDHGRPIPPFLYTMQHTYLGPLMQNAYLQTKSFFATNVTMAVNNHHAIRCLNTPPNHYTCPIHFTDPHHGLMVHYRRGRDDKNPQCNRTEYGHNVQDRTCGSHMTTLWKHLDKLQTSVEHKLLTIFG